MKVIVQAGLALNAGLNDEYKDYVIGMPLIEPTKMQAVLEKIGENEPYITELLYNQGDKKAKQAVIMIADNHYINDKNDMNILLDDSSNILILQAFTEG